MDEKFIKKKKKKMLFGSCSLGPGYSFNLETSSYCGFPTESWNWNPSPVSLLPHCYQTGLPHCTARG